MGMVLELHGATDETLARVIADPPLVWQLVAPDDTGFYEDARRAQIGFLGRLFGKRAEPASLQLTDGEGPLTDLDKAWHGIHFLLTQSAADGAPPLDFLVGGGTEIPGQEIGYGPARAFRSDEVRAIHTALAALSDDQLRARFDPAAMSREEIYPEIWLRTPPEDDPLGYLMGFCTTLRETLARLVEQRRGLVVTLT